MRISGFDDPDSSGWDALHKGTDRESFDSPSKFDMSTLSTIMPKRKPAPPPQPDEQGYTDPDTREWGSSDPILPEPEYDDEADWEDEPAEWTAPEAAPEWTAPPPAPREWTPPRGASAPQEWTPPRGAATRYPPLSAVPPPPPSGPVPAQNWTPPPPAPPQWTPPPDPETRWIPQTEPISSQSDYGWDEPVETGWHDPSRRTAVPVASAGSRVRPYTRTGGRTRSDHNLALEALVSTSDDGRRYRGVRSIEHRRICDLCLDTRSVAEIAAHLRLPLGVVKVLVGDMTDLGLVLVHQTELILGDQTSREFMERVLAGLRAL